MELTREWEQYQRGLDYKRRLDLFALVDKNERFYAGKHWEGVKANGLPTPVFNIVKRIVTFKVSSVMADSIAVNYVVDGIEDEPQDPMQASKLETAENLSKFSETTWERVKMDQSNERVLKDAALSGDGITYWYWKPDIDTGQEIAGVKVMGDLVKEEIDNVNYFPDNPNDPNVQSQPGMNLTFRQLASELKEEAKAYGTPASEIDKISSDTEYENQAGDLAKIELDEANKTICLLRLWKNKKTGTIWARKSTRYAVVRKDWDTGLRRYPVAKMSWEERKNSCHGASDVAEIIPNNIAINKLLAMVIMSVMHTAFPKAIYDANLIKGAWSNLIGQAIPVNSSGVDVRSIAAYLQPGNLSADIHKIIDTVIQYTKEMCGANETALGEVKPENTSAIIAVQQAAAIPLESVKRRFYQYIEDVALIWVDFWTTYYGPRKLMIEEDNKKIAVDYNGAEYRDVPFRVKIDVGPSTKWSEVTAIQALDKLLEQDQISFIEYLERIPEGIIPDKTKLIEDREAQNLDAVIINAHLQQFFMSLPPEVQQQLAAIGDEQAMMEQLKMMAAQSIQPQQPAAIPQQPMMGGV